MANKNNWQNFNLERASLGTVLVCIGAFILFTGLNIGFGGIASMGWQGSRDFFEISNAAVFAVRDSHVRFVGGVWAALGLLFIAGAFKPVQLRQSLLLACLLIFVGGVVRFCSFQFESLFGPQLIGSLIAEIIGMPVLFIWILTATTKGHFRS